MTVTRTLKAVKVADYMAPPGQQVPVFYMSNLPYTLSMGTWPNYMEQFVTEGELDCIARFFRAKRVTHNSWSNPLPHVYSSLLIIQYKDETWETGLLNLTFSDDLT